MKTVSRNGVFETNSSSTHSLCISFADCAVLDTLPVGKDGVCRVFPGEFGWEVETYTDSATKASYALTHAKSADYISAERSKTELQMLEKVIKEVTGAKSVEFVQREDEYHPWGYIDHQSIESGGGAGADAFESEEALKRFIFNPKSVLMTDNDNH